MPPSRRYIDAHVNGRRAMIDKSLYENVVYRRKNRVSGDDCQLIVESDISADKLGRTAHGGGIGNKCSPQPRGVANAGALRGSPRNANFG